jgi:Protein of unknown function (DUF4058)
MPSPFPGMDPYLETTYWMNTHQQLCSEIARQLAPKLRPRYVAMTSERFVLEEPEEVMVTISRGLPDVGITARSKGPNGATGSSVAAPLQLATIMPTSIPHVTVEIRDVKQKELVAAIEVLSPTNKRGDGRKEYLTKRRRMLLSTAHLLEIDFLRQGERVPMQQPLPSVPYFVLLSRSERRPITEVWPITLADSLPVVPVPLLPGDADVTLDLQLALTTIYDLLAFDLNVDYSGPPEVPLSSDESAFVEERLRAAGLRQ